MRVLFIGENPRTFLGQANTTVVLGRGYGRLSDVLASLAAAGDPVYLRDDIVRQTNVYTHVSLLCASV